MRTSLNLSSRPFTNHRLFWIAVVSVFFISLWLLLWVSAERNLVSAQIDRLNARISAQEELVKKAELDRIARSQVKPDIQLDDQQKLQLAAARQLISSKAFSWNKLIGDIEGNCRKMRRFLTVKVEEG